jgi:hypothetical protein
MAPPQHGKSKAMSDFIAWLAGVNPDIKVIFSSYSDELGARANVELQRAIKSKVFRGIFGRTVTGIDSWVCNQSLIEYADYRGSRHANDRSIKVLRYPAVAEEDTKFRYRGQALFPAFKPIDLLLERKQEMSICSWEAEYQQNPIVVGGGQLPIEKLKTVQHFERSNIVSSGGPVSSL